MSRHPKPGSLPSPLLPRTFSVLPGAVDTSNPSGGAPPDAARSPGSSPTSYKRKALDFIVPDVMVESSNDPGTIEYGDPGGGGDLDEASSSISPVAKKSRTNTPWTPDEERRLKAMRDAGSTWSAIAKTFPNRTEGSVKKHWYKDMHYADFAEDESAALLAAIKDYEANKWKEIGKKACEQYAKEHFGGKA